MPDRTSLARSRRAGTRPFPRPPLAPTPSTRPPRLTRPTRYARLTLWARTTLTAATLGLAGLAVVAIPGPALAAPTAPTTAAAVDAPVVAAPVVAAPAPAPVPADLLSAVRSGAAPRDITPAGASEGQVVAVNEGGQVLLSTPTREDAYLWSPTGTVPITFQGGPVKPLGLNNRGQVIGTAQIDDPDGPKAVLYSAGRTIALPVPGRSQPVGINDRGQVAVLSVVLPPNGEGLPDTRVYIVDGTSVRDVGVIPSLVNVSLHLNEAGQLAGNRVAANPVYDLPIGFLWDNGRILPVQTPDGPISVTGLNDHGQITGTTDRDGHRRGVFWSQGALSELPAPAGGDSAAVTLNNVGVVAGWTSPEDGPQTPVLWAAGHVVPLQGTGSNAQIVDLNERTQVLLTSTDRVPGSSERPRGHVWNAGQSVELATLGGKQAAPSALTDTGLIGGTSTLASGQSRAVLWSPVWP